MPTPPPTATVRADLAALLTRLSRDRDRVRVHRDERVVVPLVPGDAVEERPGQLDRGERAEDRLDAGAEPCRTFLMDEVAPELLRRRLQERP